MSKQQHNYYSQISGSGNVYSKMAVVQAAHIARSLYLIWCLQTAMRHFGLDVNLLQSLKYLWSFLIV